MPSSEYLARLRPLVASRFERDPGTRPERDHWQLAYSWVIDRYRSDSGDRMRGCFRSAQWTLGVNDVMPYRLAASQPTTALIERETDLGLQIVSGVTRWRCSMDYAVGAYEWLSWYAWGSPLPEWLIPPEIRDAC